MLGVISGTVPIGKNSSPENPRKLSSLNKFGCADLLATDKIIFLFRHGNDKNKYVLPHMINHRANMMALKELGASEIIGINSSGSLKKSIIPGSIVIPDDFIMLSHQESVNNNVDSHIIPTLNEGLREKCITAARSCQIDLVDGGTYWQSAGPRLETKAEIRLMSNFADLVGMTMASEAVIAREFDIPYASICSVDNFANGVVDGYLTKEEIFSNARNSIESITLIINKFVELFK